MLKLFYNNQGGMANRFLSGSTNCTGLAKNTNVKYAETTVTGVDGPLSATFRNGDTRSVCVV